MIKLKGLVENLEDLKQLVTELEDNRDYLKLIDRHVSGWTRRTIDFDTNVIETYRTMTDSKVLACLVTWKGDEDPDVSIHVI